MKNTKLLYGVAATCLLSLGCLVGCGKSKGGEDIYDGENLVLKLKNVYFDTWKGEDEYTRLLNEKFKVKIDPSNYDYSGWDGSVITAVNGDNLTDVFHFNLKAYNYGSTYEKWVKGKVLKALPDDLSKWPHLKSMIDDISNVDALKINGHLYGIPIANDISNPVKDFSNFTYVYRRDWAKQIDEANKNKAGYTPIYKEGDVYTWEEFNRLLAGFKAYPQDTQKSVLVDEKWGFPSVTNFYKDVPHCYAKDENGKAINAFTSDKYIAGLEVAKSFISENYYSQDQFNFVDGKANELYRGNQAAILYDNFSLANYIKLIKAFKKKDMTGQALADATAILKVKDPNGNFALEGTENWFSMTLFNSDISDTKQEKILDIIDWLLSEEGTRFAIYGREGYDYEMVDGKVVLNEMGWEKDSSGNYGPKINGAKYLRYMATLGNDTKAIDPFTEADWDAFQTLESWSNEMKTAKQNNKLRVVKEPADIDWMSTPTKNDKTESILNDANTHAMKYCYSYNGFKTIEDYKKKFDEDPSWGRILNEINQKLGK